MTYYRIISSPLGKLKLVATDNGLAAVLFDAGRNVEEYRHAELSPKHPVLAATERQLAEYFDGRRILFSLPLDPQGSEFQCHAWLALMTIPYGQTISYGEQARIMDMPGKSRAAGQANGANPIPVIIPCHRVIGSSGKLTGYAGGVSRKEFLLTLEAQHSYRLVDKKAA